jgi:hypothetical protein
MRCLPGSLLRFAQRLAHTFRSFFLLPIIFFISIQAVFAQEVLRGEVIVELEPVYGSFVDENYPLDNDTAYRRALEEAALFFSAQIYGWSFNYDIGERARGIAEEFELKDLGSIQWGDLRLKVTHAAFENFQLHAWMDYRPTENQLKRIRSWRAGLTRTAQAVGFGPLGGPAEVSGWFAIKKTALEDAARAAVREMLRGSERNRPKEVRGLICLQTFPRYFMDSGRWACSARFLVDVQEIVPFAAY